MNDIETWIARAIVGAVIAGCVGLFARLRKAENTVGQLSTRIESLEGRDPGVGPLRERLSELESDLSGIKATLKALPTAREFSEVSRGVTEVKGDVKAVKASVDGMDAMIKGLAKQVGSMNDHLLGKAQ